MCTICQLTSTVR